MKIILYKMVFLFLFIPQALSTQDTLTMVYRTTAKEPFIKAAPNHEGIWKKVYERAAQKIGFELNILRLPKKRAYLNLEIGDADFYPAASFKMERAKFGFYINNQFEQEGILIIYNSANKIETVDDIVDYDLLVNLGNTTRFYKDSGVDIDKNQIKYMSELDTKRAVDLVLKRTKTIYAYTDTSIHKYLDAQNKNSIGVLEVQFKKPTSYLLFSKKSPYYQEKTNPYFDPDQKLSIDNLPYMLDEKSVAFQFQEALKEIKENGEFEILSSH